VVRSDELLFEPLIVVAAVTDSENVARIASSTYFMWVS
jgi:hypothetical protein